MAEAYPVPVEDLVRLLLALEASKVTLTEARKEGALLPKCQDRDDCFAATLAAIEAGAKPFKGVMAEALAKVEKEVSRDR